MPSALAVEQLHKVYDSGLEALKGVSLEVGPGDFFAILGPNGAGKSTLIGIISSLVRKTSGRVRIFDTDIDEDFSRAKQLIGVVPQEFNFGVFEKVEDIVLQQAGYYGMPRAEATARTRMLLERLSLWDKRHTQARMLSGGMKRRLMIARALVHDPRLLILDEPTAGVDIELRRSMWDFLRDINREGTTIILTTHYLEEAESLCRHVAIIDHGRIIQNTSVRQLLQQLNREVFILDLAAPLTELPRLPGYELTRRDDQSLELAITRGQVLNPVFAELAAQGIQVVSMRNKANRLEELFVSMVNHHRHAEDVRS